MSPEDIERIVRQHADLPPLLNIQQAAKIAQRSIATIHDWSHRGLLDSIKVRRGRRLIFDRDGFVRFLLTSN